MSCGCEAYECIELLLNPCSEGASLPIVADEDGNWTGVVYFNGTVNEFDVGVVDGENVIIPADILNESYTHELKLYNSAAELVNGTCYKLKVIPSMNASTFTPPTPSDEAIYSVQAVGNGTDTQTFTYPTGMAVQTVEFQGQSYQPVDGFTQSGLSITLLNGYTFVGQIVVYYKKA